VLENCIVVFDVSGIRVGKWELGINLLELI